MLGNQIKQHPADNQGQQRCIRGNLDDVLLRCIELIEFVSRLQFTKEQLNLSTAALDRCQIPQEKRASRWIRDREMIVVGVRDEDADDTESLRIPRLRAHILTALERRFHLNVDVLTVQIRNNVLDQLAFQGNGVATPFPQFGRYNRVRAAIHPTHEVATFSSIRANHRRDGDIDTLGEQNEHGYYEWWPERDERLHILVELFPERLSTSLLTIWI